jgi:hypothetical protein
VIACAVPLRPTRKMNKHAPRTETFDDFPDSTGDLVSIDLGIKDNLDSLSYFEFHLSLLI